MSKEQTPKTESSLEPNKELILQQEQPSSKNEAEKSFYTILNETQWRVLADGASQQIQPFPTSPNNEHLSSGFESGYGTGYKPSETGVSTVIPHQVRLPMPDKQEQRNPREDNQQKCFIGCNKKSDILIQIVLIILYFGALGFVLYMFISQAYPTMRSSNAYANGDWKSHTSW